VFKVSSLASGEVSVVLHVAPTHADMAMRLMHLRGKPLTAEFTEGWEG
jgi:hypothetical protein